MQRNVMLNMFADGMKFPVAIGVSATREKQLNRSFSGSRSTNSGRGALVLVLARYGWQCDELFDAPSRPRAKGMIFIC